MTREEANAVYDVLVRECGARDESEPWWKSPRAAFVRSICTAGGLASLVFDSDLGQRGRLIYDYLGEVLCVCVPADDATPERLAMIERANAALREMKR